MCVCVTCEVGGGVMTMCADVCAIDDIVLLHCYIVCVG